MTNPPAKASSANSARQAEHDPLRPMQPEPRPEGTSRTLRAVGPRRAPDTAGTAAPGPRRRARSRRSPPGRRRPAARPGRWRRCATTPGDDRARRRSRTSRPAGSARTALRPASPGDQLAERRLLDGQERPDLVAARADDADRRRDGSTTNTGVATNASPRRASGPRRARSTRRRPIRSAWVVSHSEIAASPRSVSASSRPTSDAGEPDATRGTARGPWTGTRSRTSAGTGSRTGA